MEKLMHRCNEIFLKAILPKLAEMYESSNGTIGSGIKRARKCSCKMVLSTTITTRCHIYDQVCIHPYTCPKFESDRVCARSDILPPVNPASGELVALNATHLRLPR